MVNTSKSPTTEIELIILYKLIYCGHVVVLTMYIHICMVIESIIKIIKHKNIINGGHTFV